MLDYQNDDWKDDLREMRAEQAAKDRYMVLKLRHHDCRDPDHPGCVRCEPELFKTENGFIFSRLESE